MVDHLREESHDDLHAKSEANSVDHEDPDVFDPSFLLIIEALFRLAALIFVASTGV